MGQFADFEARVAKSIEASMAVKQMLLRDPFPILIGHILSELVEQEHFHAQGCVCRPGWGYQS